MKCIMATEGGLARGWISPDGNLVRHAKDAVKFNDDLAPHAVHWADKECPGIKHYAINSDLAEGI